MQKWETQPRGGRFPPESTKHGGKQETAHAPRVANDTIQSQI